MPVVVGLQAFLGANTFTNPKRLAAGVGAYALDLDPTHGDMRGIKAANVVHTLTGLASQQISAYRMGRDAPSDTAYWLTSSTDTDYMRSLLANDATERTYYTDGVKPRFTDNTLLGGSPPYPGSSYTLGVPAPSAAMSASITVVGTGADQDLIYTDTFLRVVNGITEESAPNSHLATITAKVGSTVTLGSFAAVPGGSHGITKRRIYCSTDGGDFLRVAEFVTSTSTFADNGTVRTLVLETGGSESKPTWLEPPDDLRGLMSLGNSMAGGFSGKSWRVCAAGHPHAWPLEYEGITADTIVGAARWGNSVLLCTTGIPYYGTGTTPADITTIQPIQFEQACVSKRSVTGVQHGVCWASPAGLCYYGQQGMLNLTEYLIPLADWKAMNPASVIGACWGRWYLGFYTPLSGPRAGFMIDTLNPTAVIFLSQGAYGVFMDTVSDQLYLLDTSYRVRKWASGSALAAQFTGLNQRQRAPTCPGAASVVATGWPVTFRLYADGVLKHTKTVANELPFVLPAGYTAQNFQIKLEGAGPIEGAIVADGPEDLP